MKTLRDSAVARWGALFVVSFTMMAAYYVNDVMAPLERLLEGQLKWTSGEYGTYTSAYSFLNVFLLMIIWGGLILDRFGVRLTGILAAALMVVGTAAEYYGMVFLGGTAMSMFGMKLDVLLASAGYALFGVGAEVAGITVTKIIAKWFAGKEMAMAMGVQVALARIGSQVAYASAIPIAKSLGLTMPLFIGGCLLLGGLLSFIAFAFMDRKLDKQVYMEKTVDEEKFSFRDVKSVVSNRGFWLIALMCVLFYSCIFPFQKFATQLMTLKYGVSEDLSGTIAGLPALGALFLTPVFGRMVDKYGKAASIMMLGSAMLIFVHFMYSLPFFHSSALAVALMIVLGIAFSLVPSAMWPSVARIFPVRQLGTAYALIFFIQNIGLWGIPVLIGKVLENYCIKGTMVIDGVEIHEYNYTLPMCIFTGIAVLSFFVGLLLRSTDRKCGYGLEDNKSRIAA